MVSKSERRSAVEHVDDNVVVRMTGTWTAAEAAELHDVFAGIEAGSDVVIDLREARYVDSTILTEFVVLRKRLDSGGGNIALLANEGAVKRILQVTSLDKAFSMNRGPLARAHMEETA